MSDIEKEFYKSFNIPQKFYTIVNFGDLDNNYQEVSANSLEELFNDYNSYFDEYIEKIEDFMDWRSGYEPITSDIVLGLENILIDKYKDITISKNQGGWYHYTADINGKGLWEVSGSKNRTEQLLSLFILLKHEISEEVKALFKC